MSTRSKVLLAEADARSAATLAKALQASGIDVVMTNDAVHTVSMARLAKPDLVVVAERLAGGGGASAMRRIRCNVHTAHLPAVGLAAGTSAQRELVAAGVQECLLQPVAPAALQEAIERNLPRSLDFTEAPAPALRSPERLAAVRESKLLDSAREPAYDRVTLLAAKLLGAPTALITLVDAERQFFKSDTGLAQPWAAARQTRLSHSFCQWVVAAKEPVAVEDAHAHPVLKRNLAVKDLGVVAYAGVPILGKDGQALGSMCAIDSRARGWSEEDLATLESLARIVESCGAPKDAAARSAAIGAATALLRRYGARIRDAEREALLAIVDEAGGVR